MLFEVKFICPAGVSSLCAMVVERAGSIIVFYTSEELPTIYVHSSINFFQDLTDLDLLYKQLTSVTFPFLWKLPSVGVAPLPPNFHKFLKRDSQDLDRFSLVDIPSKW